MTDATVPKISVLTAARNADRTIHSLFESLKRQSYRNFEWVVIDGASTDSTISLLENFVATANWARYISEPDFGLYHALNKGLQLARGQYYVVAGADDLFEPDALERYANKANETNADIVLARVTRAGKTIGGFYPRRHWISPTKVFLSSHSVGILIRRDLHERFGLYSKRFPLLADSYFLKCLLLCGSVKFDEADFTAGTFAEGGLTTTNKLQILAETWQIQMITEPSSTLQTLLFVAKLAARWPSLLRELRSPDIKS